MSEFVEENQNEVTMETMEDALDSVKEIKIGDTVIGDVLAFDDNQVRVSIQESGGLEGVVPRNELSATPVEDMTEIVNIGDEVELVVVKPIKDKENGNYLLSKKRVDAKKVWVELQEKFDNNETIEAPVKNKVKGGLVVDAGVRGFVPASMIEDFFVEDFTPYVGETLEFKIIEIDPNENRLILSHKEIAREEREAKRAEAMENLEEGAIVEGTVARLVNFGAFIDLGGVDGLVHISRIAHEHVEKPSDFLTPGETVKVKVLSVDPEAGRVSLSIKELQPGPWDTVDEEYAAGTETTGIVKRIVDFGAFVELKPGVEGLVHISEMSHRHVETPHEVVGENEEVKVKVLSVDQDEQRVSLSIKALEEAPEREEQPRQESRQESRKQPRQEVRQPQLRDEEDDSAFTIGDQLGDQLKGLFGNDDE